jgi:hypothetical protein
MAEVATDEATAAEFVQRSDNATVYYGRPGQGVPTTLGASRSHEPTTNRFGESPPRSNSTARTSFNAAAPPRSFADRGAATSDRLESDTSDQDVGSQGAGERYDGEQWPRKSRTLGSNRRSIAEQRQLQIRQIPQNRPGMNP